MVFPRDFGRVSWSSVIAVILRHGCENECTVCNFSIWTVADVGLGLCKKPVLCQRNRIHDTVVSKFISASRGSPCDSMASCTVVRSAKNSLLRDFCFNAIHCDRIIIIVLQSQQQLSFLFTFMRHSTGQTTVKLLINGDIWNQLVFNGRFSEAEGFQYDRLAF